MEGREIAPHQARISQLTGTRIELPDYLAFLVDDLAARAECSPAAALEWLIWGALIAAGQRPPRRVHWQTRAAWKRLELVAKPPSFPRSTMKSAARKSLIVERVQLRRAKLRSPSVKRRRNSPPGAPAAQLPETFDRGGAACSAGILLDDQLDEALANAPSLADLAPRIRR